jgi:hypothetical protein
MRTSEFQLNRFERILFRLAIALAVMIVAVRIGALVALWCLRY